MSKVRRLPVLCALLFSINIANTVVGQQRMEEVRPTKVEITQADGRCYLTFDVELGCSYSVATSTSLSGDWNLASEQWPRILSPPTFSWELPMPTNGAQFFRVSGNRDARTDIYDGGDVTLNKGQSNSLYRLMGEVALATSFPTNVKYFKVGSDMLYRYQPLQESKSYERWTYVVASNHVARIEQHQRILRELKTIPEVLYSFPMFGSEFLPFRPSAALTDEILVPPRCGMPEGMADEVELIENLGGSWKVMRIRNPREIDPLQFCLDVFQQRPNSSCGDIVPNFLGFILPAGQ